MTRHRAAGALIALSLGLVAAVQAHAAPSNLPAKGDQRFGWKIQRLPLGGDHGEPSILTVRGQTVVDTFGPTMWTSTNHGKSWVLRKRIGDPDCPSGDADHTILADGTILADNLCLAGPTNLIYKSTDHGRTWVPAGPANAVPAEAGTDSDRQWLTADPKDPKVVWMSYHDLAGPNIWVAKSLDGGATWPIRVPASAFGTQYVDSSQGNTTARVVVHAEGEQRTLYLFYAYSDVVDALAGNASPDEPDFLLRKVGMAKSTDGGLTWANSTIYDGTKDKARLGHLFTVSAIDPAGGLYVAFSMRKEPSKSTAIYLLRSSNGGATWGPPVRASDKANGSNVMPSITAPKPGVVDLAYYATRVGDFDSRAGEWAPIFTQTKNALAPTPKFAHSRIGGANHNRDICLAGTLCLVTGGNRNLADFLGITYDARGLAQVVWTEDVECAGCTMYAEQTRQP